MKDYNGNRGVYQYKEGMKTGHEMPHRPETKQVTQSKAKPKDNGNSGKSMASGSK